MCWWYGHHTVAHHPTDMQAAIDLVGVYSKNHRYKINPTKSATILYNTQVKTAVELEAVRFHIQMITPILGSWEIKQTQSILMPEFNWLEDQCMHLWVLACMAKMALHPRYLIIYGWHTEFQGRCMELSFPPTSYPISPNSMLFRGRHLDSFNFFQRNNPM